MTWRGYTETLDMMAQRKRKARMSRVDELPPELRDLVNEYGFNVVENFMSNGVLKAKRIRHLVELVLDEFSPTRTCRSKQGIRTPEALTRPMGETLPPAQKLEGQLLSALEEILPMAEDKWANPEAVSEIVNARRLLVSHGRATATEADHG